MTLDPQAAEVVRLGAEAPEPWEQPLATLRDDYLASVPALFGPVDEVAAVEDTAADGVPVRIYRPGPEARAALVYLHGGGWVIGSVETHDPVCRRLAARAGCTVVSVDYRLAPEHPFPAAVEDAWTAFAWLAQNADALGLDRARLAVGGDSAGGNLAAVVARRARDRGIALAFQLLVYPALDHAFGTASYREHGDGLNLTRAEMEWYWQQYLGGRDGGDPDASPLRAGDLGGVAPALVLTAGFDPLRDEGEAYAERLAAAGVPAQVLRYPGLIHGFLRMRAAVDAAAAALDEVADALREALSTS